jgi:hypothetical protein
MLATPGERTEEGGTHKSTAWQRERESERENDRPRGSERASERARERELRIRSSITLYTNTLPPKLIIDLHFYVHAYTHLCTSFHMCTHTHMRIALTGDRPPSRKPSPAPSTVQNGFSTQSVVYEVRQPYRKSSPAACACVPDALWRTRCSAQGGACLVPPPLPSPSAHPLAASHRTH